MKIEETAIDHIRARPRFKIFTEISRENYTTFLKHFLASKSDEFSGNINAETAVITVKTGQDDYWKPCLALRTETEENKTVIRCFRTQFCSLDLLYVSLFYFRDSVDGLYYHLVCRTADQKQ